MSAHRSVAVLGPMPRDRITTHRGEVFEKYGCALYTVAAPSALMDADDRTHPVVHAWFPSRDALEHHEAGAPIDLGELPRVPVAVVVDTTGCGDSFAAGMAFGYLVDGDIARAAQYGNAMGAQRCSGSGLDVYLLPETDTQLARAYGAAAGTGA